MKSAGIWLEARRGWCRQSRTGLRSGAEALHGSQLCTCLVDWGGPGTIGQDLQEALAGAGAVDQAQALNGWRQGGLARGLATCGERERSAHKHQIIDPVGSVGTCMHSQIVGQLRPGMATPGGTEKLVRLE